MVDVSSVYPKMVSNVDETVETTGTKNASLIKNTISRIKTICF